MTFGERTGAGGLRELLVLEARNEVISEGEMA